MNIPIFIASILAFLGFVLHTFVGDRELKLIEPEDVADDNYLKREKWTMARSGWHWISLDLLFATLGLTLINFTDVLDNEGQLLQLLSIYFFGYGIVWLIGITLSKRFPNNYLKLGQWLLLWVISALIFLGTS